MEEAEGVLSIDFEGGLDAVPMNSNHSMSSINLDSSSAAVMAGGSSLPGTASDPYAINVAGRRSFRQTVCHHWLRGLCMKGEACGFLPQYDKSRMPICRFFRLFGECREHDCVYKHSNEDIKECKMYKLGFCPNGPDCRCRHAKLHGPPPTVEEAIQKIQSLVSFNYNSNNMFIPNRNAGFIQPSEESQFPQRVIGADQNFVPKLSTTELTNEQQQESQQAMQPIGKTQTLIISNDQLQESMMAFPLPQGVSRHFQGCAKMTSKIGGYVGGENWKYAHGTAHYGGNFRVKWCKVLLTGGSTGTMLEALDVIGDGCNDSLGDEDGTATAAAARGEYELRNLGRGPRAVGKHAETGRGTEKLSFKPARKKGS